MNDLVSRILSVFPKSATLSDQSQGDDARPIRLLTEEELSSVVGGRAVVAAAQVGNQLPKTGGW